VGGPSPPQPLNARQIEPTPQSKLKHFKLDIAHQDCPLLDVVFDGVNLV
jgi:hypothetical protein